MKLALIGATGFVGSQLLVEATARGHHVTAIARSASKVEKSDRVTPLAVDIANELALVQALRGHDAAISATKFLETDAARLIRAIRDSGVPRWLVVGGAGSLEVAPGVELVDTPQFPREYHAEASAGREFLRRLRGETGVEWTFLSPAALLVPGPRTGKFRVGGDRLIVDETGESRISVADYAMAMIDEVERPQHSRRRFTVGY